MGRNRMYSTDAERQRAYRQRNQDAYRNTQMLQNDVARKVDRPALRYFGGKFRLAEWVISQFPPHVTYVEPFSGGASVLLSKTPSTFEVINDLDQDVINFFDCLRDAPERLIRAILLTPYARAEHRRAEHANPVSLEPFERARLFYVKMQQGFGSGLGKWSGGWRFVKGGGDNTRADPVQQFNDVEHLWAVAARLKQVQIECDDALKVIARYDAPGTLFYVDPPYVHSTRHPDTTRGKGYKHEMTDEQHRELAERLKSLRGMVIVSGYPSALYGELFAGWMCIRRSSMDVLAQEQTECLWLSPSVEASQLPMFRGAL